VIGQRHFQGNLYIYLDASVPRVRLVLKSPTQSLERGEDPPYLIDSRWPLWDLHSNVSNFNFLTQGFGPGEMTWTLPWSGETTITFQSRSKLPMQSQKLHVGVGADGTLKFTLPQSSDPLYVEINRVRAG